MKALCISTILWLCLACANVQAGTLQMVGMGVGSFDVPVTSLRESRFLATTRQQYDFSCGSAAVATLLTYHYNYPVSERAVFEDMYERGNQEKIRREGFSLLDIKAYLGRKDFVADAFELPLAKLLESGLPALVLISEKGYNHFVVVKGIQDGRVLIGDPSSGTHAMSQVAFEKIWQSRLLFVIHNKQDQARFNNSAEWRVAPRAPLASGLSSDPSTALSWPKLGPGDY
ncbi:peptidase C39 [Rhodoferax lacus]|uniref:Peptidase C39 n=1 Tax=Rhodoferax lacus TaxID=2184758 RepID=A0A3E1R6I1_9BURK|nr:C39 family peptidase [Rhodoferax lacus]RFO94672.1 peptidase C39 [Rhodoferax lacus]